MRGCDKIARIAGIAKVAEIESQNRSDLDQALVDRTAVSKRSIVNS